MLVFLKILRTYQMNDPHDEVAYCNGRSIFARTTTEYSRNPNPKITRTSNTNKPTYQFNWHNTCRK